MKLRLSTTGGFVDLGLRSWGMNAPRSQVSPGETLAAFYDTRCVWGAFECHVDESLYVIFIELNDVTAEEENTTSRNVLSDGLNSNSAATNNCRLIWTKRCAEGQI